jgi:hypothetical protein
MIENSGVDSFIAMTSCISWFLKRRALAFGVIAAGASLGGVIFPVSPFYKLLTCQIKNIN